MSKLAALAVAAGMFAAVPAFITSAQANDSQPAIKLAAADVSVRVGEGDRYHDRHHRHDWRRDRACEKKVIWHHGHKTVIKKCG
jgi:hypothetical protein